MLHRRDVFALGLYGYGDSLGRLILIAAGALTARLAGLLGAANEMPLLLQEGDAQFGSTAKDFSSVRSAFELLQDDFLEERAFLPYYWFPFDYFLLFRR